MLLNDNIFLNKDKSNFEKLQYILVKYPVQSIPNGWVECPFCDATITKSSVQNDLDICSIVLDKDNIPYYSLKTPCCKHEVAKLNVWISNTITDEELWAEARNRYWHIFKNAEEIYKKRKDQYKLICDIIYEHDYI